jgi:hypothetical protein
MTFVGQTTIPPLRYPPAVNRIYKLVRTAGSGVYNVQRDFCWD